MTSLDLSAASGDRRFPMKERYISGKFLIPYTDLTYHLNNTLIYVNSAALVLKHADAL
jgi:hypothetical protein